MDFRYLIIEISGYRNVGAEILGEGGRASNMNSGI